MLADRSEHEARRGVSTEEELISDLANQVLEMLDESALDDHAQLLVIQRALDWSLIRGYDIGCEHTIWNPLPDMLGKQKRELIHRRIPGQPGPDRPGSGGERK